jgi:polysaccharide biosynthesis/export protein
VADYRRRARAAAFLATALLCAGCAGTPGDGQFRTMSDAAGTVASDPAPIVPVETDPSEYRIVSGDILSIAVYQVPDLNRDAQVDAAGYIVLPLIRGVPVAGRTVRDVEAQLTDRLRAKYIQNPQVTVAVKDAVGARVSVQGAVREPGIIPVRGEVTLTAVLAQAKGFTETADRSSVVVIRNTAQGRVAARVDAAAILSGVGPDPKIYPGDVVMVEDSLLRTSIKDVLSVLTGAAAIKFLAPGG